MKVSSVYTAGEEHNSSGRSFGTNKISITPAGSITDPVITDITPEKVTIQDGPAFMLKPDALPDDVRLSDAIVIKQAAGKVIDQAGEAVGKAADYVTGKVGAAADNAKNKLILIGAGLVLLLIVTR